MPHGYWHLEMAKISLSRIQNTEESEEFRDPWIVDYLELFRRNRLHTLKVEKNISKFKRNFEEKYVPSSSSSSGKI